MSISEILLGLKESRMKDVLGMISLTTAASILLIIAAVWLIILIIKKQHEYIFRAMMIMLILLLAMIFLRQHEAGTLTMPQLISKIFPKKTPDYIFTISRGYVGLKEEVRYVFQDPKPKLSLQLDKSGTYFNISDIRPINEVLKQLKLPPIEEAVPELAFITKVKMDVNLYRWTDYPLGTLTLERAVCQDKQTLEVYNGIIRITLLK
jgi:hypothetical protein